MTAEIYLNPSLNRSELREAFARQRRVHIPKVLTNSAAERLHKAITQETQWHLLFNEGKTPYTLYPEQVKALTPDHLSKIRDIVLSQARNGFQYLYSDYNIYDYYLNGKNMDHYLHRFHEFINSEGFLSFVREITGIESIRFADSQATAFGPGNFLTLHHDQAAGKNRRVAYVFNMTQKWNLDWGGVLQFLGPDGNVEQGFVPTFNALNMFEIPQGHAVSYVAPYAPEIRYSITGWLRETDDSDHMNQTA